MDLSDESQTLVIIGNGMVGFKLCQRMVEYGANDEIRIVVFGEEPRQAYDRVHLTEMLSGRPSSSLGLVPKDWYKHNGIELFTGDRIVEVDREASVVRSENGRRVEYNRLVFATGSAPFVPPIEGRDLPGVFTYRTVEDVYDIEDYAAEVESAAVIGGGLLGLEAAQAVHELGLAVHVIEVAPWLLPRQLDAEGGAVLRDKIEKLGVKVHTGKKLVRIEALPSPDGSDIEGPRRLHFESGPPLTVDMVVFSAGIKPRGEVARAAGIRMADNGGIIVDDRLQTSDQQIYAIGECATHRGITYGLVIPGYQMVDVLAANLLGGELVFEGSDMSAKLKLLGITVAALGEHDGDKRLGGNALVFDGGGVYRKLVVRNGRLIGAVTVGDWENLERIRELLKSPLPLSFWDMRRFRGTGNLWPKSESEPVTQWAADAIVCGCLRVTRGAIGAAIAAGCSSVEEVGTKTNAGTLCGSCKPLISELLGLEGPPSVFEPMPQSWREGPRSRRGGDGPRSRRGGEGPRSRRGESPSSRLVPSSTIDDAPRSRRDGTPSSLERVSSVDLAPPSVRDLAPPSRRVAITISERPPPPNAVIGLRSLGLSIAQGSPPPTDEPEVEPGPLSVRGRAIWKNDDEDADAGPMSMRSATLSSRPEVDLPPPTLRSSIPPPPSSLLMSPGVAAALATPAVPAKAVENAPPTPRSIGSYELKPSVSTPAPVTPRTGEVTAEPTPRSIGTFEHKPSPPSRSAPRSVSLTPPVGIEIAPRSVRAALAMPISPTPAAGMARVDPSAMLGGPASSRAEPATPKTGAAVSGSTAAPPSTMRPPARDLPPPSVPRSTRSPLSAPVVDIEIRVAAAATLGGSSLVTNPTPASGIPRVVASSSLTAEAPPTSRRSAIVISGPSSSSAPAPSSTRSITLPPPSSRVAIIEANIDIPPLPRLPASMFSGDEPPSSRSSLDPGSSPASSEDTVQESDSAQTSRISLLSGVDEAEIADILSVPRDSLLPGAPIGDRAPMSRRSWVPPKRLSIPPGTLSLSVAPPRPTAASIQVPPERGRKILLVASVVAVSWCLVLVLAPSIPPSRSVQSGAFAESLFRGATSRQVTGYSLVAFTLLGLGISLRKRWKRFKVSDVAVWRAVHGVVGALSLVLFFLHTGLHAGSRLNFVLAFDFLAVTVLGAIAGGIYAWSERWSPVVARDRRLRSSFIHLLLTWPLPILIALHVVAVYYY